jgi:hypothetical protein
MALMTTTRSKIKATIVVLLVYSILQIGVQLVFAQPAPAVTKVAIPQQVVGRLTTTNNQPVTVNGLSASSGAAIASGATIETKAGQFATVDLGSLGRVDIGENTKVVLTFDGNGQLKAVVETGCVNLTGKKGTTGEVTSPSGTVGTINPGTGGVVTMCPRPPGPPPAPPGEGGGLFGLGTTATLAIVGAGDVALWTYLILQDNPSPS